MPTYCWRVQFGQYPDPTHTIAHVSDTHLLGGGRLQYGAIDTVARGTGRR